MADKQAVLGNGAKFTGKISNSKSIEINGSVQADLLTEKVNTHPLLNQLEWQIKTSSANIYLNTLEGKPQFGLGLDYSIINPRKDALPTYNGRDILIPKLTFSIPLYRKKIRAKKQEEELKQKSFNLQKEQMHNRLLTNLKKHITAYENAMLRHKLYEKKITIAQSAYRILLLSLIHN